ncbi:MAG: response regulator [Candidatus Omnitrophica bacterium]|nr:response regulator [Candidatus Omnitrophota bacterium]
MKILIVDDEVGLCFFVKKNLEAAGDFQVAACSDSMKAVSEARGFSPDLIILDVMMPGLSGPELVEKFQEDPKLKRIPVIFLTAVATEEETGKNRNLIGGHYMVAKPVQIEELLQVITKVMQERSATG